MKVLLIGGAGYLGGAMAPLLLEEGHELTVFDNLSFGEAAITPLLKQTGFKLISGDLTDILAVSKATQGQDAVILLAALVGEPACDKDPEQTVAINYLGTINAMKAALKHGVRRFIYSSTDSCYGAQEGVLLTEESPLKPISLYAELKSEVEEEFLQLYNKPGFYPTILRLATLYGLAPRMRFDLVINLLTREAATGGAAKIFSGEQWRPLVHVQDAARAFAQTLSAPPEVVANEIFNVGSNAQNVQFKDLARLLLEALPQANIETVPQPPDLRDYHVCFDKISKALGFKPNFTLQAGIAEIRDALASGLLGDPYNPKYRNA